MKIESQEKISKDDRAIYIQICFNIWGGVPVDYDWATKTNFYIKSLEDFKQK